MAKRGYSSEEIIHKLREADVLLGRGRTVAEVAKQLAVTEQTYFRWRKAYGGLKVDQAKRLSELEADLTVDKLILREVAEGKFSAQRASGRRSAT